LGYRAEHEGIDVSSVCDPWNHPALKQFYKEQWTDISNAIKKYGNKAVLQVVGDKSNRWIGNPKYGNNPLRIGKIRQQLEAATRTS
jgi:hypothetical protein